MHYHCLTFNLLPLGARIPLLRYDFGCLVTNMCQQLSLKLGLCFGSHHTTFQCHNEKNDYSLTLKHFGCFALLMCSTENTHASAPSRRASALSKSTSVTASLRAAYTKKKSYTVNKTHPTSVYLVSKKYEILKFRQNVGYVF